MVCEREPHIHHPLQNRPITEAPDLFEAPFEFVEALRAAFQESVLFEPVDSTHNAYGNNTARM